MNGNPCRIYIGIRKTAIMAWGTRFLQAANKSIIAKIFFMSKSILFNSLEKSLGKI